MTLTYDPATAAIQNGFYPSPYSIATNRMITQTSITPYIASPVSAYQVCTFSVHQEYDNLLAMNHCYIFMCLKILNIYCEI
nr:RNA-binding motif, single-stranded-interacting protein 1-like [Manis javanica]